MHCPNNNNNNSNNNVDNNNVDNNSNYQYHIAIPPNEIAININNIPGVNNLGLFSLEQSRYCS